MDTFLGLLTLALLGYFIIWEDWLRPLLGLDKPLDRPKSVKTSAPLPAYRSRSRRSSPVNGVNARSAQQDAVQAPVNVQLGVQRSAVPADGALQVTPNELQQLAESLQLRARGATVQEAIEGGFGVKKGGTEGYKRAKLLFDTATQPPQPGA